jgi:hypothetical protein
MNTTEVESSYHEPTQEERSAIMRAALTALAEIDSDYTTNFQHPGALCVGRISPDELQEVYEAVRYAVKFRPFERG